jgi:hypothetical protein
LRGVASWNWSTHCGFWSKRNVPKSVGCISFSFDNYFPVFYDVDVVLGEESDAVVVTELRVPWRSSKKMADLRLFGKGG